MRGRLLLVVAAALRRRGLTVDGAGGTHPGMRQRAVERALGVPLRIAYLDPSQACGTAGFRIGTTRGYAIFYGPRLASLWFQHSVFLVEGCA